MPKYNFIIWNTRSRVRYPRSFDLTDIEVVREVATKIARVFGEVVPRWSDLTESSVKNPDPVEGIGRSDAPNDLILQDCGLVAVDFLRFVFPL